MNTGWNIDHSKEFCLSAIAFSESLAKQASAPNLPTDVEARVLGEIAHAEKLLEVTQGLQSGKVDPLKVLRLSKDEKGNPVYLLEVGHFRGYYYLNVKKQFGTGVACKYIR